MTKYDKQAAQRGMANYNNPMRCYTGSFFTLHVNIFFLNCDLISRRFLNNNKSLENSFQISSEVILT